LNIKLEKLAIGTAQFGSSYGIANKIGRVEKKETVRILDFLKKKNILTIDTAKQYGQSEKIIGDYLRNKPNNEWVIITKVKSNGVSLINQLYDSINRLGVLPDVVLAHSAEDYLNPKYCKELHSLKLNLGIKKIGVSVYNSNEIKKILSINLPDVIQCPLNILDTRLYRNGLLDRLYHMGIEIHARSVFLQGLFFLSENKLKQSFADVYPAIKKLQLISKSANLTLPELSLLWVCSLDQVSKVIIGVDSINQLELHMKTLKKKISQKIINRALSVIYENSRILNPSLWK